MNPQQDKNQIEVPGLSFDSSDQKLDKAFELDDSLNTYNAELYKDSRSQKAINSFNGLQWKKNNWSSGWASNWNWNLGGNRHQMVQRIHRTASSFVRNKNCTMLKINSTENTRHSNGLDTETFSVHLDPIIYRTFGEADAAEAYTIDAIAQVISLSDKAIDNGAYNKMLPSGFNNKSAAIRLILVEYIRQEGLIALAKEMPGWRSRIEAFKTKSNKKGKTYASKKILLLLKVFAGQENQIPAKDKKAALAIKQKIKDQLSSSLSSNFDEENDKLYDDITRYLTCPTPETKIIALAKSLLKTLADLRFDNIISKKAVYIRKYGVSAERTNQLICQFQRLEDMILIHTNYIAIKGHKLINDKLPLAFLDKAIASNAHYALVAKSNRVFYPATTRKVPKNQMDEDLQLKLQSHDFHKAHANIEKTLFDLRICQNLIWSISEKGTFALNHQEENELRAESTRLLNEVDKLYHSANEHTSKTLKSIMACIAIPPGDTPSSLNPNFKSNLHVKNFIQIEILNNTFSAVFRDSQDFDLSSAKLLIQTGCKFKSKKAFERAKNICLASRDKNAEYCRLQENVNSQARAVRDKILKIPQSDDFNSKLDYSLKTIRNLINVLTKNLEDILEDQSALAFEHIPASDTPAPLDVFQEAAGKPVKKTLSPDQQELCFSEEPKTAEEDEIFGEDDDPMNTETIIFILN